MAITPKTNYIKDHDPQLMRGGAGRPICSEMQYLVQFRHPLESLQSHFDFLVYHKRSEDRADLWHRFLDRRLDYWKAFVRKWCLAPDFPTDVHVHRVRYDVLCANTRGTATQVIAFLTEGTETLDPDRLQTALDQFSNGFARYRQEEDGGERVLKTRDIREFRYFGDRLRRIEEDLIPDYLEPLGLTPLLSR